MGRQDVTFVVSPRRAAGDVEIKTIAVGVIGRCSQCDRLEPAGESTHQQGRRFMEMILAHAHGYFWDGMREVMRERGYMQ